MEGVSAPAACTWEQCQIWQETASLNFNCSLPGLTGLSPGSHEGVEANYLSFATELSSPNFVTRAEEFFSCTGGRIVFSEANNVFEDPVHDIGTRRSRGTELYDGYLMSYSHFPEVAALGLAEPLNDRIRTNNDRLEWEDFLPKVREMGTYRRNGANEIDFLMFDGDFFVPIVRLDLLEQQGLPIPNTWEEVVEYAQFFNGTDLNGDGDANDFGFCHFPRLGAGYWDWWWAEAIYATWASLDQTEGINQGFFFDDTTLQPRIGNGFKKSVGIWKELWKHGATSCNDNMFMEGRCAIGFAPPGCWKATFLHGVSRKDANESVVWQPKMSTGEYAEPYRLKPFGSTSVIDRRTGEFVLCTPSLCPNAEKIPRWGHHGVDHRSNVLQPSKLSGRLINRSPFYWSGGLGTLIRKSAQDENKDLLWDFFVYINSQETSVRDVAHYSSWLDSWRFSQLSSGDNFLEAGWSKVAYDEHRRIMQWALSNNANAAFNLRLPGMAKYTRDVVGTNVMKFISGATSMNDLVLAVESGWEEIHTQEGKLSQLDIYRASLNLDRLDDFVLCQHHRFLMDCEDPSICAKFDNGAKWLTVAIVLAFGLVALVATAVAVVAERQRRAADSFWNLSATELEFASPPEILGRGTSGLVVAALYRGTKVAVKEVCPIEIDEGNGGTQLESSVFLVGSSHFGEAKIQPQVTSSKYQRSMRAGMSLQTKDDFRKEMKLLAHFRHPNVTTIMEKSSTSAGDGTSFAGPSACILTRRKELMEHGSLQDLLTNSTLQIDGSMLLPILQDISRGMRFLHAANPKVIHGDLKGTNILVDSRFRAKVADYGLSLKTMTVTSDTLFWMAPELLLGKCTPNPSTDVYSFGIVMCEMIARKCPYSEFDHEEQEAVIDRITDPTIALRPSIPSDCSKHIVTLMSECVDASPEQRPSFDEIDLRVSRLDEDCFGSSIGQAFTLKKEAALNVELLSRVFPKHVAEALRDGREVEADRSELATVFFSDIVGFTTLCSTLSADQVSDMLDRLYRKLDDLTTKHDIFKVETIGDAYICASSLLKPQKLDHVKRIAEFAFDALQAASETPILKDGSMGCVKMRAGFHSGPLIARVVGSSNPRYCLFGDTVNVASRMESTSEVNQIQCTQFSAELLALQCPSILQEPRGLIPIKGKGEMATVFIHPATGVRADTATSAQDMGTTPPL